MVKKPKKTKPAENTDVPLSESVQNSAQQIWQAGLGAFSRAQAEGSKAFEALVKDGVNLQRKTQTAAEEKLTQVSSMSAMASTLASSAAGPWDRLESIFEDRVAKALNRLGVPSAADIKILSERIDALNQRLQALPAPSPAPRTTPKTTPKTAPKAAAQKATRKSTKLANPDSW